jgi:hypothetical protein
VQPQAVMGTPPPDSAPQVESIAKPAAHSPFIGFAAGICSGWVLMLRLGDSELNL